MYLINIVRSYFVAELINWKVFFFFLLSYFLLKNNLACYCIFRWDIAAIDPLPNYMKICFIALHNTINDITSNAVKDHGVNVIQYLKKMVTSILIGNFCFSLHVLFFSNPH